MKRFSPVLLLFLNGCFSCGTSSHRQPVDEGLKVYRPAVPPLSDRHSSDALERVKPGDWVRYQVAKDGSDQTFTVGAVRIEDTSLWIEVVEEGDPKKASLRRVSFDGEVLSARFQEIPAAGPSSEIADQPTSSSSDPEVLRPASVKSETTKFAIGAREVEAIALRKIFRDDSIGREFEVIEIWSEEIPPLYEQLGETAGLVSRKSPTESVTLLDWGTGYSPASR